MKKFKSTFTQLPSGLALIIVTSLYTVSAFATPRSPTNLTVEGGNAVVLNECLNMNPDWVFCSGFEEGNKDIWDDYDGNPDSTNLIMEDPGPNNIAGNHIMRLRVPEGRGGSDLVKVLPGTHDNVYARWYIKWENGYDFNALNHGGGLHAGTRDQLGASGNRPNGDDWFRVTIEPTPDTHVFTTYAYYRGMYMDCYDPNGSCWGDLYPVRSNPITQDTLQTDRWYCVEMMIQSGTPVNEALQADGVLNFWIDNQEIGPFNNLWFRTSDNVKPSILWLRLFHHDTHSVEGVMYDNIVVSTSRIGCI